MTEAITQLQNGAAALPAEVEQILFDLNPWWTLGTLRKPPPPYLRRNVPELLESMSRPQGLIEVVRGPRQVGKTTAIEQIIYHLLRGRARPLDMLFVRFDQEVLRNVPGGLLQIVRWFEARVRRRP